MPSFIQRLLGQAKPVATLQATKPRVLNTQEMRAVAGGPIVKNDDA